MFFPEKITLIQKSSRVLEIGPGASPHPRANVLLELSYSDENELAKQSGVQSMPATDDRTVFYNGGKFPFDNNEFDYVICSHVLEHVPDVEAFCREIFRVGRAGYIEYPLAYYEFVFDFSVHINLLKQVDETLIFGKKSELLPLDIMELAQLWRMALTAGYNDTVTDLVPYLMEGFEWSSPFELRRTSQLRELQHRSLEIPAKQRPFPGLLWRILNKAHKTWATISTRN